MNIKDITTKIANHYLASAKAANDFSKFGVPTDLETHVEEFRKGDAAMQELTAKYQKAIDDMNLMRDAASKGDFNLAKARHTTLTS